MPELPEVQTVVQTLAPHAVGKVIWEINVHRPDVVRPMHVNLARKSIGRRIVSIARRGKQIIWTLEDGNRFVIHLGMSGRLTLEPADSGLAPHTHVVIHVGNSVQRTRQIRFRDPRRFGGVWWIGSEEPAGAMGPEPLTMKTGELVKRLGKTTRAIKNALLDQHLIAGLGNIYVDESLFEAGIHPLARADKLSVEQIARLNRAIKAVLKRALKHRGSTLRDYRDADGTAGGFQSLHRVYGRTDQPCHTCKRPLKRIVIGGRSTHFCPRCQTRS